MDIGIIDADLIGGGTNHPNLALMKISGYHKGRGNSTNLLLDYFSLEKYNLVYISKVFSFSKIPNEIQNLPNIIVGGSGFFEDGGPDLPYEIEHHMPDYHLYDKFISNQISNGKTKKNFSEYLDFSIGFTTRGCFRKCNFCINKKYDKVFEHSPVKEFLDESKPGIYLWDDNILGFSGWERILDDLENTNKYIQFRQGLDIRLLNNNKAKKLSKIKYKGDYIFAFDYIKDREIIEKKLRLWREYSKKTTKLYILCAYESQGHLDIRNTFERIRIIMKYSCIPYIMRYDAYKKSQYKDMYTQITRWCNQPKIFKKMSFREFCIANQCYIKTKRKCKSLSVMEEYENENPEIAKEYFDMKFENTSIF